VTTQVARPGGAFAPALSPNGRELAYVHRAIDETVLIVRDLTTGRERILVRGLDRDRQMSPSTLGASPAIAWHPDGTRLFVAVGGHVTAVNTTTGQADRIAFTARVEREASETIRFAQVEPHERATTRGHRWGSRIRPGHPLRGVRRPVAGGPHRRPAQPHPLGGARDEPRRRPPVRAPSTTPRGPTTAWAPSTRRRRSTRRRCA
jgi:hypothetical protein